jgi:hypothetical protein
MNALANYEQEQVFAARDAVRRTYLANSYAGSRLPAANPRKRMSVTWITAVS